MQVVSMLNSVSNKVGTTVNNLIQSSVGDILERRDAVKYKCKAILEHNFQELILTNPTHCSQCKDLIKGFTGQSCSLCQLVSHKRCLNRINIRCSQAFNKPLEEFEHNLKPEMFFTPTFCDHCGTLVTWFGSKGLSCKSCHLNVHNKCMRLIRSRPCVLELVSEFDNDNSNGRNSPDTLDGRKDSIAWDKVSFEDFQPIRLLGRGSSSKVLLVELKGFEGLDSTPTATAANSSPLVGGLTRQERTRYAIKIIKKTDINDPESVMTEMKILNFGRSLHHFLARLHCCFQSVDRLYFVMEYVDGKDLFYYIFQNSDGQKSKFEEERCKFYAAEIFLAVEYLHRRQIIHRDLKLENVILEKSGHCKLIDFGLSKELCQDNLMARTFCGTPRYISPEIIEEKLYNFCVDWWAFGVMIYEMLLSKSPFADVSSNDDEIYDRVLHEDPMEKFPRTYSPEVRDLVSRLLEKDARHRIGCVILEGCSEAIKQHDFFKFNQKHEWDKILYQQFTVPPLPETTQRNNHQINYASDSLRLTPIIAGQVKVIAQDDFKDFAFSSESFKELLNIS